MSGLQIFSLVLAVVFGLATGLLAVYAAKANQVQFGRPSPLIGRKMRGNWQRWEHAHRSAPPYLWTASAIALIQTLVFTLGAIKPNLVSGTYLAVLALLGVGLIVALLRLAGRQ